MLLPHLSLFSAVSIRQGVLVTGRKRLLLHVHCCALLYFRCSVLRICVSILPRLATVNHPSLPLKWWHKQVNRVKEQISPSPLISPHQWSTTSLLIHTHQAQHFTFILAHLHTRTFRMRFINIPRALIRLHSNSYVALVMVRKNLVRLIRCCTCWPRICMSSTYEWNFYRYSMRLFRLRGDETQINIRTILPMSQSFTFHFNDPTIYHTTTLRMKVSILILILPYGYKPTHVRVSVSILADSYLKWDTEMLLYSTAPHSYKNKNGCLWGEVSYTSKHFTLFATNISNFNNSPLNLMWAILGIHLITFTTLKCAYIRWK